MDASKPLRAGLFSYEVFRFLLLIAFLFIAPLNGGSAGSDSENGVLVPYSVYLSANALFPLMALFVMLKPREYCNYLNLYMAGKVIGGISFYVWEFFSRLRFTPASFEFGNGPANAAALVLFGCIFLISLADILSVWGAWTLKNKFRQVTENVPVCGGV